MKDLAPKHRISLLKHLFVLLSCLIVIIGTPATARDATNAAPLAPNDWRQLLGDTYYQWKAKSEAEIKKLADDGHPAAQYLIWSKLRKSDRQKAQAMLESAAAAGLPQALFEKGSWTFVDSRLTRTQRLDGWALMERSAATGFPYAQWKVAEYDAGRISSQGMVQPNLNRALTYLRNASDFGYPEAATELALLYSSGIGEPRRDSESPHKLLVAAANDGSVDALGFLSERYTLGHGETTDPLEGARLRFIVRYRHPEPSDTKILDNKNNPVAQDSVALDNMVQILSLFAKAALDKNPEAAASLAKRYMDAQKPAESLVLWEFAWKLGGRNLEDNIKRLETAVTNEQRTAAAKRFPFLDL